MATKKKSAVKKKSPKRLPAKFADQQPAQRGRDAREKGRKFEDQVVDLLRLMRFDVKPRENYGCREVDFVAVEPGAFSQNWYAGECKAQEKKIGVEEVAQLLSRVTSLKSKEGTQNVTGLLVVANEDRIGDEARGHARSLGCIQIITYRELQDRVVNL